MSTSTRRLATRALRAVPAFVRAHDAAVDLRRAATDTAEDAAHEARRAAKRVQRAAEQRVHESRTAIRRNPLRSVALAALVGSMAGAITALVARRPRREQPDA